MSEPPIDTVRSGSGSSGRRVAFRILASLTAVAGLAYLLVGMAEVVLMWVPDATLLSLLDHIKPAELDFRAQFNHIGLISWALFPALAVQLRAPRRRVAPMLQALGVAGAGVVVMAICGSLESVDVAVFAVLALLAWLHPAGGELVRRARLDLRQAVIVAIGALPWLMMAAANVGQAWASAGLDVADTSDTMLWAYSALLPVVIVIMALVGSTDLRGWHLPAWTAALAAIEVGVHSLAFPDQAASLQGPWAVAAVVWGAGFAAASLARSRRVQRA